MEQNLADEERIPLRFGVHRGGEIEPLGGELVACRRLHQRGDLVTVEAVEVEAGHARDATQVGEHVRERVGAVEIGIAIRAEYEQPHRRRRA